MPPADQAAVAVTGVGATLAGALGADALWALLEQGPTGALTSGSDVPLVADLMTAKERSRSTPAMRYALQAATEAVEQAQGVAHVDPGRRAVVMATLYGSPGAIVAAEDESPPSPFLTITAGENAAAATVAARFACRGPVRAVVTACAGGTDAIVDAVDLLRSHRADLVVAGGTQEALTPGLRSAYEELRVVSASGHLRPFDRRRDGFVPTEGAAVVVLERLDDARRRGVPVLAHVLGGAATNDADHPVRPSGAGARACVEAALVDAGVSASQLVAVNAHGTATWVNDALEARLLDGLCDGAAPPVTSNKGVTGHTFAAAGAIEAVATVLSMRAGLLPPATVGFEPDPDLPIDVVHDRARPWTPGPTLSTSFGLGGQNAAIVLAPPPVDHR